MIRHPEADNGRHTKQGVGRRPEPRKRARGRERGFAAGGARARRTPDGGYDVECDTDEPTEKVKKKTNWGKIVVTGALSAAGAIVAYRIYEKATGRQATSNQPVENPSRARVMDARDMLIMSSPGAAEHVHNPMLAAMAAAPAVNPGPSSREIDLSEQNAQLREQLAAIQAFMAGQKAAESTPKHDPLAALIAGMDDD